MDRNPILQFVQGPHRTAADASQLDEDHGEVAEDEPHAEAQTDQNPWMAKAQYQHREGLEIVEPLFCGARAVDCGLDKLSLAQCHHDLRQVGGLEGSAIS